MILQAIHFITSYKSTSTGDDNTAWSFVVVMFAGVILTVFGKKKKRMTEIFALLILVVTNRLYREFQFLHSYIVDVWFWQ